jgi:hypothetical protein
MRDQLKPLLHKRTRFSATFQCYGSKSGWHHQETTLLLVDVKTLEGKIVADHIWFTQRKRFEIMGLVPGDQVQFNARVDTYWKGYRGYRDEYDGEEGAIQMDYKLAYPTDIKLVGRVAAPPPPLSPSLKDRRPWNFSQPGSEAQQRPDR